MNGRGSRTITVLRPGMLATLQDLGRVGFAHLGVPRSGAADMLSHRLANRLLGNPASSATIEVLGGGAAFRFDADAAVTVTGATVPVQIAGYAVSADAWHHVAAGEMLELGPVSRGLRAYVAVAGGVEVPPVLGSRATDTLSGLGPPVLEEGVTLPIGARFGEHPATPADVVRSPVPQGDEVEIAVSRGPRDSWLTQESLRTLTTAAWVVTADSNRVGARLSGVRLAYAVERQLPSEGMVLGAIQVPASGQPIVFLADHPTTGGYPVVGVVDTAGVATIAQSPPGQRLRFTFPRS